MRTSYWLIAGALIAVSLAFAFWPSHTYRQKPSPPGQYPLDASRPEWTAIQSLGLYRPRGRSGQDTLAPSWTQDAKQSCGGDRVTKPCTLPTVPLGPQYTPTLLLQA